jgi:FkbM family methyltransferase
MQNALDKEELQKGIARVQTIAEVSKIRRLLRNPFKYIFAIAVREWYFKQFGRSKDLVCKTFFDQKMTIRLPSSTDIYLTGGKSHPSEIKLARFLIHTLNPGDTFVDVGAHYGYFSLLAAQLVGDKGRVFAFEAANQTYTILVINASPNPIITTLQRVVSDKLEAQTFFEFPIMYSEYNTVNKEQFTREDWFNRFSPAETIVDGITLDHFFSTDRPIPMLVKIDVEGAEHSVINGMTQLIQKHHPTIVMEYLRSEDPDSSHQQAIEQLLELGYTPHFIDHRGWPQPVEDVEAEMAARELLSENVVLVHGK